MSKKDSKQGEGNRVADGASVFDPNNDSHVATSSPIQLKRKELRAAAVDKTYRTPLAPNTPREKLTTKTRMDKEVKPI